MISFFSQKDQQNHIINILHVLASIAQGPYGKLWILDFFLVLIFMACALHAWAIKERKKLSPFYNLPYRPCTRLIKGMYTILLYIYQPVYCSLKIFLTA